MRYGAFVDSCVLAQMVADTHTGLTVRKVLNNAGIRILTFRKCIYELYSILKGTSRKANSGSSPLQSFLKTGINDIAQKLFNDCPEITNDTAYLWFSLCEEWRYNGRIQGFAERAGEMLTEETQQEALEWVQKQQEFCRWKREIEASFQKVRKSIEEIRVEVIEYDEVFGSSWYLERGHRLQEELAFHSLLPNEDFEIVLAAICSGADVFLTTDNRRLMWRGATSMGFNIATPCFCHPSRLQECLAEDFGVRSYMPRSTEK